MSDAAPHKSLARDIIISVIAASGVMAFIVAVAAQFAIDWIREGVETQGLEGFWFPIVVTLLIVLAVGTVLVLLALSVLRPRWRMRVWAPFIGRVRAILPVTTLRFENELVALEGSDRILREQAQSKSASDSAERMAEAKRVDAALSEVRESIPKVLVTLLTPFIDDKKSMAKELANLRAEVESLKKEWKGAAPQPSVPSPAPRWRLTDITSEKSRNSGVSRFRIENLIPGSVVRNARMDNAPDTYGRFRFDDAAYWGELTGPAVGEFIGAVEGTDESGDVYMRLSWLREDNATQTATFRVSAPGKQPKPHVEVPF